MMELCTRIQKEIVTLKYLTSRRSAPDSAEELIIQSGSSFESVKKKIKSSYELIFFYKKPQMLLCTVRLQNQALQTKEL